MSFRDKHVCFRFDAGTWMQEKEGKIKKRKIKNSATKICYFLISWQSPAVRQVSENNHISISTRFSAIYPVWTKITSGCFSGWDVNRVSKNERESMMGEGSSQGHSVLWEPGGGVAGRRAWMRGGGGWGVGGGRRWGWEEWLLTHLGAGEEVMTSGQPCKSRKPRR